MKKSFFPGAGELVREKISEIVTSFCDNISSFSVSRFIKLRVPKCRKLYVDFKKKMYHTLFLGVMCIYFHLYTRKCQNSELASHSTVRNPYTKSLSGKNSFIPIKYKYLPSF